MSTKMNLGTIIFVSLLSSLVFANDVDDVWYYDMIVGHSGTIVIPKPHNINDSLKLKCIPESVPNCERGIKFSQTANDIRLDIENASFKLHEDYEFVYNDTTRIMGVSINVRSKSCKSDYLWTVNTSYLIGMRYTCNISMESTNITWHETVTSNSNITGFNLYEYGTVTGHTAYETFNGTVKTATLSVYIGDIVNGTMSYQLSYIVRGRRIIHMFHQSGNMNIVFKYLDVNLEDSLYLTCPKIWGHWIRRSFDDVNWYAASENTLLHIDRLNFTDNGIYKCSHELFRDIYVINATRVGNIRKIVTKTIIIPMDIVDALISTMSIIKITAVAACLLGLFIFIVVVVWRKCASIRNVRSINDYSMMTV